MTHVSTELAYTGVDLDEAVELPLPYLSAYECKRCDVAGRGHVCWSCGENDELTRKYLTPLQLNQPHAATLDQLDPIFQPDTDQEESHATEPAH